MRRCCGIVIGCEHIYRYACFCVVMNGARVRPPLFHQRLRTAARGSQAGEFPAPTRHTALPRLSFSRPTRPRLMPTVADAISRHGIVRGFDICTSQQAASSRESCKGCSQGPGTYGSVQPRRTWLYYEKHETTLTVCQAASPKIVLYVVMLIRAGFTGWEPLAQCGQRPGRLVARNRLCLWL